MAEFTKQEVKDITNKLAEFYDELEPFLGRIIDNINNKHAIHSLFFAADNAATLLICAFIWDDSREGWNFWSCVHDFLFERAEKIRIKTLDK